MYVELKQLSKSFDKRMIVDHLDLSLEKGKILCLLGSSGCGKTTTLKMIGGFHWDHEWGETGADRITSGHLSSSEGFLCDELLRDFQSDSAAGWR